jgi:DNA-directed RNA polymerase subunit H (RpoH/RPB5)
MRTNYDKLESTAEHGPTKHVAGSTDVGLSAVLAPAVDTQKANPTGAKAVSPQTTNPIVVNEAGLIEGLAVKSLTGDATAANGLAKEAHAILTSPCRNFMDALNKQLADDRLKTSSLPEIKIEDHVALTVSQGANDQIFKSDGSVGVSIHDKLGPAVLANIVDDKVAPQKRNFLEPQSQAKAIVDLGSALENLAKKSLTGDVNAANEFAKAVQAMKDYPKLLNSLNEQFAFDKVQHQEIPKIQVIDADEDQNTKAGLKIVNPEEPRDKQEFSFNGMVGTWAHDNLANAILNHEVGK